MRGRRLDYAFALDYVTMTTLWNAPASSPESHGVLVQHHSHDCMQCLLVEVELCVSLVSASSSLPTASREESGKSKSSKKGHPANTTAGVVMINTVIGGLDF